MTDAKIAVSQVQEIQLILYDIYKEEMVLSESLYVIVIIKMLISYWNNFRTILNISKRRWELKSHFKIKDRRWQ